MGLVDDTEFEAGGLAGFVEDAELVAAQVFEAGIDEVLVGAVAQRRAVEEPPAPAAAAEGGDFQAQGLLAGGGQAQLVAFAYADDRQR